MTDHSETAGALCPDPSLSPADVVRISLDALRANDAPYADHGVETVYSFASPDVRRATGSLPRFSDFVHRRYRPLFDVAHVGTTPVERSDRRAIQEVTVVDGDGRETVYEFRLARQRGG
ncbi:DUF4864 domain-containing protein, partial [Halobium palmae]